MVEDIEFAGSHRSGSQRPRYLLQCASRNQSPCRSYVEHAVERLFDASKFLPDGQRHDPLHEWDHWQTQRSHAQSQEHRFTSSIPGWSSY